MFVLIIFFNKKLWLKKNGPLGMKNLQIPQIFVNFADNSS